jgi:hypothetical protein
MPLDPSLPKHLQHLLEKRQGAGRRKQDDVKSELASANEKLASGTDRRKSSRRKPKPAKSRAINSNTAKSHRA